MNGFLSELEEIRDVCKQNADYSEVRLKEYVSFLKETAEKADRVLNNAQFNDLLKAEKEIEGLKRRIEDMAAENFRLKISLKEIHNTFNAIFSTKSEYITDYVNKIGDIAEKALDND